MSSRSVDRFRIAKFNPGIHKVRYSFHFIFYNAEKSNGSVKFNSLVFQQEYLFMVSLLCVWAHKSSDRISKHYDQHQLNSFSAENLIVLKTVEQIFICTNLRYVFFNVKSSWCCLGSVIVITLSCILKIRDFKDTVRWDLKGEKTLSMKHRQWICNILP